MNKTLLAVVLIVIIVAGSYVVYQSSDGTPSPTPTPTSSLDASTEDEDTSGVDVAISNNEYSPNNITVAVGTTVTWTNNDSVAHTVTGDTGPEMLNSPLFSAGQTFSYTFTKAGTYTYHCTPHPTMLGTVVVTE